MKNIASTLFALLVFAKHVRSNHGSFSSRRRHALSRLEPTSPHLKIRDWPITIRSEPTDDWEEGPCLIDRDQPRLLSVDNKSDANNPNWCIKTCEAQNFNIAGVQNRNECWCGNSLDFGGDSPKSRYAPNGDEECSMLCMEGGQHQCGGAWRLKIFGKGAALDRYNFDTTESCGQIGSKEESSQTMDEPKVTADSISSKLVVAHHMIGNTYPYSFNTWISDMNLAKSASIDGFALNVGQGGGGSWQRDRISDAFQAATSFGGSFGVFFSFDMTALGCNNQNDAAILRDYLINFATSPGQLTLPPRTGSYLQRAVVSTFAGEWCTFGRGSVRDGWASVLADPSVVAALQTMGREVAFIPSWFQRIEQRKQEFGSLVNGDFHWNGGWPAGGGDITWDTDAYHQQYNPGPLYMAAVSPWFFTHYGANSYNKNWIYRGDDWLYSSRWEQVMAHRDQIDIAQIVTWNDYGESSYIGPIEGDQPNSQAWVNGYPHIGWLKMTSFYAQGFKNGVFPGISKDQVFLWSRPHRRDKDIPADSVGRPNNWQWTEDYLWALVFATQPGTFTLRSGSNSQTFSVVGGVNKFKIANSPGSIQGTLSLPAGIPVVDVNPGNDFAFTENPGSYNFNAFVASS